MRNRLNLSQIRAEIVERIETIKSKRLAEEDQNRRAYLSGELIVYMHILDLLGTR